MCGWNTLGSNGHAVNLLTGVLTPVPIGSGFLAPKVACLSGVTISIALTHWKYMELLGPFQVTQWRGLRLRPRSIFYMYMKASLLLVVFVHKIVTAEPFRVDRRTIFDHLFSSCQVSPRRYTVTSTKPCLVSRSLTGVASAVAQATAPSRIARKREQSSPNPNTNPRLSR